MFPATIRESYQSFGRSTNSIFMFFPQIFLRHTIVLMRSLCVCVCVCVFCSLTFQSYGLPPFLLHPLPEKIPHANTNEGSRQESGANIKSSS